MWDYVHKRDIWTSLAAVSMTVVHLVSMDEDPRKQQQRFWW